MMISDLKLAAGDKEEEEQSIDGDDDFIYDRTPIPGIIDTPIDPSTIVRADAFALKKQSHPLQLAPFILAIEPDTSVLLDPCRPNYSNWTPGHARVCGAVGTCPWSDEDNVVQTHTIGLFATHPSVSADDDLIVYIIDGKDHDFVDNEDYLECRNAAVDAFKTKVLHLPCSTPHAIHVVGFSRLPVNDWIHSSLHVRQCFRQLAETLSNSSTISIFSSLSVHVGNCFSSSRSDNAFPSDALFDGVMVQMARRCWTKDLEDLTTCLINRDNEPALCANAFCDKHVSMARYCSSTCFTRGWKDHNRLHRLHLNAIALDHQQQQQQQEEEEEEEEEVVVDDDEAKPEAAVMKVESGLDAVRTTGGCIASPTASGGVRIVGATGDRAALINGIYEATTEISGDMPVYAKVDSHGSLGLCLEYSKKQWLMKPTSQKGKSGVFAFCAVPAQGTPEKCLPGQWRVNNGDKLVLQPTVTISVVTQAEVDDHRAQVRREAARVVIGSHNVRIAGVTGPNAGIVNGVYKPSEEKSDNATVYVKVDDGNMWLEYCFALKHWQLKLTAAKGTARCTASCAVPAKCLPEECPPGQWKVANGTKLDPQSAVTISVQHDNGDAVSADDIDVDEAKPKAAAMKVDSGLAAAQTVGVGGGIASPTASGGVRIDGATGPNSVAINGIYEATTELSGDLPVYAKVGCRDFCLEYRADRKQWQLKLTSSKGTDGCRAFCPVPDKCLPEKCPAGQWEVNIGGKWGPQPAVTISVVTVEEVDAHRSQVAREAGRVLKGSHNVRITGATGSNAGHINGLYKPTKELCDNATVYVKVNDGKMLLEYHAAHMQWQVKSTTSKGTSRCTMYCAVPGKCLPEDCPAGQWKVYDSTKYDPQPAVTISVQHGNNDAVNADDVDDDEAKPKAAAMKVAAGHVVAQPAGLSPFATPGSVQIVGAMGPNAGAINGMYEATPEVSGGMRVYAKVGDGDMLLEYRAAKSQWQVKSTAHKGKDTCFALCAVPAKCLPQECPAGRWQIVVNDKYVSLPAIVISEVTVAEVEALRAQVEEEAARVVNGTHNVTIAGATGSNADYINGVFKPSEEFCGNVTVYVKVGDGNMWLEYCSTLQQWQVKTTAYKGTTSSCAFCVIPAKCLPEDCPRGKWLINNGTNWGPQQTITIAVQRDNSDAVGVDDVDDDEAKPKAAAMKVDSGVAAAQTVGGGISSSTASGGIRIVGAMGQNAGLINGIYAATPEMSGSMPVYAKVGCRDLCLEYRADRRLWQMKSISQKGKDGGFALCAVPAKCLPEDCPPGQWKVNIGGKLVLQPTIVISVVTQAEVEAHLEQVEREAAHVVNGSHNVRIVGATGLIADYVNGVYKPTEEFCDNATVYVKIDDGSCWLEYRAGMKQWQVKPTHSKGTPRCTAYCDVPAKCLPEDCPPGQWKVYDGTKLDPQSAVTISVQHDNNDDAVGADDVDDDEAKPKAAAMKVAAGSAATKTAGMGIATHAAPGGVRIVGATGPTAGAINGMYQPTTKMSGGMPTYVKVGDGDIWLEYDVAHKRWLVRTTSVICTSVCVAGCVVPAKCVPEDCPDQWEVCDGGKLIPQPTIAISVVNQAEVEVYLAEVEREAARVVNGSHNVRIAGATGPNASCINGVYKPTAELCDNVTVYAKIGDGDVWLEYHAAHMSWMVRPTTSKGTDGGFALCAVPVKCLPEKCPPGQWEVGDGDKVVPQPAITIKQKKRER